MSVNNQLKQTNEIINLGADGNPDCALLSLSAGQEIVITRWIGISGTLQIIDKKEKELLKRFSVPFLDMARELRDVKVTEYEAATAGKSGVSAVWPLGEGGIFNALWDMGKAAGVGLEVDLKRIPVKQETIEICNYFDLNPYRLDSTGSVMIVTEHGYSLVMELEQQNIPAEVVGRITDNNDRVVLNGENRRFMEKPQPDELSKLAMCK